MGCLWVQNYKLRRNRQIFCKINFQEPCTRNARPFVSFVSEGSIADYVVGETHKITQTTRKQPKHNPLLLNEVYTTVSERPLLYLILYIPIYYIRCGNDTQQSDNDKTCFHLLHLFFPHPLNLAY